MIAVTSKGIPVLMYHGIENGQNPYKAESAGELLYVISQNQFDEQLSYLHENGYEFYSFDDFHVKIPPTRKSCVITFDDGNKSDLSLAQPVLAKYRAKATFYVTTDWIGRDKNLLKEDIEYLYSVGMGIGSHGKSHLFFNDLGNEDLKNELVESKKVLEEIIQSEVNTISAPGGRVGERVKSIIIDSGYTSICNSNIGLWRGQDLTDITRIAIKRNIGMSEFISMFEKTEKYIRKKKALAKVVQLMKYSLGNDGYHGFHNIMSKILLRR